MGSKGVFLVSVRVYTYCTETHTRNTFELREYIESQVKMKKKKTFKELYHSDDFQRSEEGKTKTKVKI